MHDELKLTPEEEAALSREEAPEEANGYIHGDGVHAWIEPKDKKLPALGKRFIYGDYMDVVTKRAGKYKAQFKCLGRVLKMRQDTQEELE